MLLENKNLSLNKGAKNGWNSLLIDGWTSSTFRLVLIRVNVYNGTTSTTTGSGDQYSLPFRDKFSRGRKS